MNFFDAVASVFLKFLTWEGRAPRSEYWYFQLFLCFFPTVLSLMVDQKDAAFLASGGMMFIFLPILSVTIRRLHDTDRSGWWAWLVLIPLIGPLILLIFMLLPSDQYRNYYGENPFGARW